MHHRNAMNEIHENGKVLIDQQFYFTNMQFNHLQSRPCIASSSAGPIPVPTWPGNEAKTLYMCHDIGQFSDKVPQCFPICQTLNYSADFI